MNRYYYLDVSLRFDQSPLDEVTLSFFKHGIITAVSVLFGEVTSSINIDILKFDPCTRRAILRVPLHFYVKLRSSLTLCGVYEGKKCIYIVHKASPILLNLQGDSREYQY